MAPSVALVAHWDWVLYNFRLPLARRLRDLGAQVTFVSPHGRYVSHLETAGFRWVEWAVDRRGLNPLAEAASVARLARLYRRSGFVAVHHFTIKPVLYGTLAAWLAGTPHVIETFTGLGFLFSSDPSARALRAAVAPLLRWVLHRPGVVTVFQNPDDRRRLVEAGLAPDSSQVIAGSGVDVERFAPRARPDGAPTVVLAARLLWDKGVAEFVEAARRLRRRGVAARFWVVGSPDPGNPRSIPERQISAWRDEGPVEFLGHQDDMPAILRQAHVAVLPSYHEGVPKFLLEAAAAGLPLVASDIPGCREVVQSEINGLLVPPRDPAALAAALGRLIGDAGVRQAMGAAARATAVERFDERQIADRYESLYREAGVLGAARPSGPPQPAGPVSSATPR